MNKKIKGLYALVDDTYQGVMPLFDQALAMLDNGVKLMQLRMKLSPREVVTSLSYQIGKLKDKYSFTYILNDYPDLAKETGADGVHIGQQDISVAQARKILGPYGLIGKSNHSFDEFRQSHLEHTDYLALGAIYPTKAKGPDHPVVGTALLEKVSALSTKPIVAIGGINELNLQEIKTNGATAFAVVSGLVAGGRIGQNVKKLIALWENLP
jgi:thiamine-phosphate diphosphorylase